MIKFDPSQITIDIVRLKSITTALGGSLNYVDESQSTDTKEVTKRLSCPLSVARSFIQKHKKVTKYLIPVWTAVVKYNDRIICLERHPLGTFGELEHEGLGGQVKHWEPDSQLNLFRYVYPLVSKPNRQWFFDGRYIYSFNDLNIETNIQSAPTLTKCGSFRKITAVSLDTQELANATKLDVVERSCIAFVASNGQFSISPPIWKDVSSVGSKQFEEHDDSSAIGSDLFSFDKVNENLSVNLNFALAAGRLIGSNFGYSFVEPLQLPRLMIELHTVNLPNIPKQIKATYDIGIEFTHCMAWLLGLLQKADDLDTYIMMRSLLKYLTQKGLFFNKSFQTQNIFKEDQSVNTIQLQNLDELVKQIDYTKINITNIIKKSKSKQSSSNVTYLGQGISNDEL